MSFYKKRKALLFFVALLWAPSYVSAMVINCYERLGMENLIELNLNHDQKNTLQHADIPLDDQDSFPGDPLQSHAIHSPSSKEDLISMECFLYASNFTNHNSLLPLWQQRRLSFPTRTYTDIAPLDVVTDRRFYDCHRQVISKYAQFLGDRESANLFYTDEAVTRGFLLSRIGNILFKNSAVDYVIYQSNNRTQPQPSHLIVKWFKEANWCPTIEGDYAGKTIKDNHTYYLWRGAGKQRIPGDAANQEEVTVFTELANLSNDRVLFTIDNSHPQDDLGRKSRLKFFFGKFPLHSKEQVFWYDFSCLLPYKCMDKFHSRDPLNSDVINGCNSQKEIEAFERLCSVSWENIESIIQSDRIKLEQSGINILSGDYNLKLMKLFRNTRNEVCREFEECLNSNKNDSEQKFMD